MSSSRNTKHTFVLHSDKGKARTNKLYSHARQAVQRARRRRAIEVLRPSRPLPVKEFTISSQSSSLSTTTSQSQTSVGERVLKPIPLMGSESTPTKLPDRSANFTLLEMNLPPSSTHLLNPTAPTDLWMPEMPLVSSTASYYLEGQQPLHHCHHPAAQELCWDDSTSMAAIDDWAASFADLDGITLQGCQNHTGHGFLESQWDVPCLPGSVFMTIEPDDGRWSSWTDSRAMGRH